MGKGQHDILSRWEWLDSDVVTKLVTSPSRKLTLIYLTLKWSRRDSGQAWPSAATIASHTGLSLRTVYSCLKELEKKKLIIRVPKTEHNKNSTLWMINFDLKSRADLEKEIEDFYEKSVQETDLMKSTNILDEMHKLEGKLDNAGV